MYEEHSLISCRSIRMKSIEASGVRLSTSKKVREAHLYIFRDTHKL